MREQHNRRAYDGHPAPMSPRAKVVVTTIIVVWCGCWAAVIERILVATEHTTHAQEMHHG